MIDRVNGGFGGVVKGRQCKQCLGFVAPCQCLVLLYKVHYARGGHGAERGHRSGAVDDGFNNNERRRDVRARTVLSTFDVAHAGKSGHFVSLGVWEFVCE